MKTKFTLIAKSYIGMTPQDKGCTSWKQMQEQMVEDLIQAANSTNDPNISPKEAIKAEFSHITPRYEKTFNVVFIGSDGNNLNTICKWIKNSHDVNHYLVLDYGYVVGCNEVGKYSISELERLKAVDAVAYALKSVVAKWFNNNVTNYLK